MARKPEPTTAPVTALFQTAVRFHEQGTLDRAEHLYREVLRQQPRHADALNMLGVIGCQTGNLQAGAQLIRQALALEPDNADYNNNLGMALLQLGETDAAIDALQRSVRARPRFPEAQFNLGNALVAKRELDLAEKHYRKALRARPDYPDALNNLANLLRERGDPSAAVKVLHKLVRTQPDLAEAHFNLALALQSLGRYAEAIAAFRDALQRAPGEARMWEALGDCCRRCGALADAEEAYRASMAHGRPRPALLNAIGMTRFARNRIEAARESFEQALALDAGVAMTHNCIGMAASAAGEREVARASFERAVELDPGCGEAWRNLAELARGADARDALIGRLQTLRAGDADSGAPEVDFALGKLLDEAGDYDAAFAALTRANAHRNRSARFDAAAQARVIDAMTSVFSPAYLSRPVPGASDSETPVFIVGMPRSGTSLVEQILASHARVHGAGELTWFPEHVPGLARRLGSERPFPYCVPGNEARLGELVPGYLELLASHGGEAARVCDKMPYNFLYLGLIALLFPRARVIHCRRDPMATCFSIYSKDLAGSHPYAYDLGHLGAAYRNYRRLMEHWREALPVAFLDVDYEYLLDQPEACSRELVEFLGLRWDPACLEFHRTRRAVTTASQWQVREPLYTTSRDHWRHYTPYLGPLAAALEGPEA